MQNIRFRRRSIALIAISCVAQLSPRLSAQTAVASARDASSDRAVMEQLVALRDSFVNQIKAEGLDPRLRPPKIILDNPPSYGNYDDETNILHIAAWRTLTPDDQGRFVRLADLLKEGRTGQEIFQDSVHRWIFVHELGHWWQACQHRDAGDLYHVEYGANRIAAAFWRLQDPAFMEAREKHFRAVIAPLPNPVPEGQSKEQFFNANYEQLAGTSAYTWYQAVMVLDVCEERPAPSFLQTLQQPVHP